MKDASPGQRHRDKEIARLNTLVASLRAQNSELRSSISWRAKATLQGWYRRALRLLHWFVTLRVVRRLTERRQIHRIKMSGLFDADYYLFEYSDVATTGMDPALHYVRYGRREGRQALPTATGPIRGGRGFVPGKENVLLVSHEASRTGAPIVALNIAQRLCQKYNVITLLMRGGNLIDNFKDVSARVICLREGARPEDEIGRVLKKHPLRYAIVNSIARPDILTTLGSAFVPTITLIHEFASYSRLLAP